MTISFFNKKELLTPVTCASAANVVGTYYNGPKNDGVNATLTVAATSLTVDGVVVALNDRVLLKDQSSALQNGIYFVESIGSTVVLKRAPDFNSSLLCKPGLFGVVKSGTANAGAYFHIGNPQVNVVGVDSIAITVFNSAVVRPDIFDNTGLKVRDISNTETLTFQPGSTFTADRVFTLVTGDADRTLTLSGDAILDRDLTTSSSPTFTEVSLGTYQTGNTGLRLVSVDPLYYLTLSTNEDFIDDRTLEINMNDSSRTIDLRADADIQSQGAVITAANSYDEALASVGIKRGKSAMHNVAGTSQVFSAPGVLATDSVNVTIASQSSTAVVSLILRADENIEVFFDVPPGNDTSIYWIANSV